MEVTVLCYITLLCYILMARITRNGHLELVRVEIPHRIILVYFGDLDTLVGLFFKRSKGLGILDNMIVCCGFINGFQFIYFTLQLLDLLYHFLKQLTFNWWPLMGFMQALLVLRRIFYVHILIYLSLKLIFLSINLLWPQLWWILLFDKIFGRILFISIILMKRRKRSWTLKFLINVFENL